MITFRVLDRYQNICLVNILFNNTTEILTNVRADEKTFMIIDNKYNVAYENHFNFNLN